MPHQAAASNKQRGCGVRPAAVVCKQAAGAGHAPIQAASAKVGVLTQEGSCSDLPISVRRSSELEASTWHIRITGVLCPLS